MKKSITLILFVFISLVGISQEKNSTSERSRNPNSSEDLNPKLKTDNVFTFEKQRNPNKVDTINYSTIYIDSLNKYQSERMQRK